MLYMPNRVTARSGPSPQKAAGRRAQAPFGRPGDAGDVGPTEDVGLVHAAVVLAGRAVPVLEGPDGPHQAAEAPEGLGEVEGDERLVDALLGLQIAITARGLRVAVDDDGDHRPRVAVREVELGPGSRDGVGVLPVLVVRPGDPRDAVQLGPAGRRRRVLQEDEGRRRRGPEAEAHGAPQVAVEAELPLVGC